MTTIACILLVGMVMKNAIMMVDYALDAERHRGLNAHDAILLAARLRARPITMTMLAAFLSAVPIAFGTGPGFEIRQPLGITIMGGLVVAQLFTLYSTPAMYLILDRLRRRKRRRRGRRLGIRCRRCAGSARSQRLSLATTFAQAPAAEVGCNRDAKEAGLRPSEPLPPPRWTFAMNGT